MFLKDLERYNFIKIIIRDAYVLLEQRVQCKMRAVETSYRNRPLMIKIAENSEEKSKLRSHGCL